MKKSVYALLFIHMIVFIISCEQSSDEPEIELCPTGNYVSTAGNLGNPGCKTSYTRNSSEQVELKTIDENKLQVKHSDALLNCEPGEISFICYAGEGIVSIKEKETSTQANCRCPYDLDYTINMLQYGTYTLYINNQSFGTFEFTAQTDVTLQKYATAKP